MSRKRRRRRRLSRRKYRQQQRQQRYLARQRREQRYEANGKKIRRPIPPPLRRMVRERDGNICRRKNCLRPITPERRRTIHHINGDPGDNRFSWDRDDLKRNNLVQWCESCQREYHHCQPKPRPKPDGGQSAADGR